MSADVIQSDRGRAAMAAVKQGSDWQQLPCPFRYHRQVPIAALGFISKTFLFLRAYHSIERQARARKLLPLILFGDRKVMGTHGDVPRK